MLDAFKHLSAQQIARLIQYAEAGDGDEKPDGGRLHAEKNAPWVNGMYSSLRFPPYEFRPYPKWLFSADYLQCDAEWRAACARRYRNTETDWQAVIKDAQERREACLLLVQNADEERAAGTTWAETPQLAIENREKLARAVAQAAAESAYDDRRMSPAAQAEREAADMASESHLVEVKETPIPVHAKKK